MVTPGYLTYHPNPRKPALALPAGACDAHCHVFGPAAQFPYAPTSSYVPVDAPKDVLFERHAFLGIERAVIVQAGCHGSDNAAMLDALRAGGDAYRGVAIVTPDIPQGDLEEFNAAGVRGVRFNFVKRLKARQSLDARRSVVEKLAPLGWHVVVYLEPDGMAEIVPFLREIAVPVVIDHMGLIPVEKGAGSREFGALADLLASDPKFWVKVSCPERLSNSGPPYDDVDEVARALVAQFPERVLWGTDWPHPNMTSHVPDDGLLVDRIAVICPTEAERKQLLVENPRRLYWAECG